MGKKTYWGSLWDNMIQTNPNLLDKFKEAANYDPMAVDAISDLKPLNNSEESTISEKEVNENLELDELANAMEEAEAMEVVAAEEEERRSKFKDVPKETIKPIEEFAEQNEMPVEDVINYAKVLNKIDTLEFKSPYKKKQKELATAASVDIHTGNLFGDLATNAYLDVKNLLYDYTHVDESLGNGKAFEEDEKEYKELLKTKRDFEKPIAEKQLEKNILAQKEANALREEYGNSPEVQQMLKDANSLNTNTLTPGQVMYKSSLIGSEGQKYNTAIEILEAEEKRLKDFINNEDGALDGFVNQGSNIMSLGILPMANQMSVVKAEKKVRDKVELTKGEEALLKADALKQEVQSMDLQKGRFWYRFGEGLGHTTAFIGEMIATKGITAGAGGKVAFEAVKELNNLAIKPLMSHLGRETIKGLTRAELRKISAINIVKRGVIGSGDVLAGGLVAPYAYEQAGIKFVGVNKLITDVDGNEKVLVTKNQRTTEIKLGRNKLAILNSQITQIQNDENLSEEEKKTQIESKYNEISRIYELFNNMYDPSKSLKRKKTESDAEYFERRAVEISEEDLEDDVSGVDAGIYGYWEWTKEAGSERFAGSALKKVGKGAGLLIGKGAEKSARFAKVVDWTDRRITTPIGNFSKIGNKWGESLDKTYKNLGMMSKNAAFHTGKNKLWHGIGPEIWEEVAVQLTPSYMEDYSKQLEELSNPQFYLDVTAQTLALGKAMKTLSSTPHYAQYVTSKKYRDAFKFSKKRDLVKKQKIKGFYDELDKSVTDEDAIKQILMFTDGTLFDNSDYQAQIEKYRVEGKKQEADELEEKAIYNIGRHALETGTLDTYLQSIKNFSNREGVSPRIKKNLDKATEYYREFKAVEDKYEGHINKKKLIELELQSLSNVRTLEDIRKQIKKNEAAGLAFIKQYSEKEGKDFNLEEVKNITQKVENSSNEKFVKYLRDILDTGNVAANDYIAFTLLKERNENLQYENILAIGKAQKIETQESIQQQNVADLLGVIDNTNSIEVLDKIEGALNNYNSLSKENQTKIDNKRTELRREEILSENVPPSIPAQIVEDPELTEIPDEEVPEEISESQSLEIGQQAMSAFGNPVEGGIAEEKSNADNTDMEAQSLFDPSTFDLEDAFNKISSYIKKRDGEVTLKTLKDFINALEGTDLQKKQMYTAFEKLFLAEDRKVAVEKAQSIIAQFDSNPDVDSTKDEVIKSAEKTEEAITKKEISEVDNNGEKVNVEDSALKKASGEITAAVLSKPFKEILVQQDDGTVKKVKVDDPEKELENSPYIDSTVHLNPERLNPGAKVVVEIPEGDMASSAHYSNILVYNYSDKEAGILDKDHPKVPFKTWMRLNNVVEGSQEWWDNIPMIAWEVDAEGNKIQAKGALFIHSVNWWNKDNTAKFKGDIKKQQEVIKDGQEKHRELRNLVKSNKSLTLEVTEKRMGFFTYYPKDGELPTLAENRQGQESEIKLVTIDDTGGILYPHKGSAENQNFQNKFPETVIENRKEIDKDSGQTVFTNLERGHVYEVRRGATKDAVILLKTMNPPIRENDKVVTTMVQAVKAFMKNDTKVLDTLGIKTADDLKAYLSNFGYFKFTELMTPLVPGKPREVRQSVKNQFNVRETINEKGETVKVYVSKPFMFFTGKNSERLVFGKGSGNSYMGVSYKKLDAGNVDTVINEFEAFLRSGQVVEKEGKKFTTGVVQNFNAKSLQKDVQITFVDASGNFVEKVAYKDFLNQTLKTTVKSYNIGTAQDPDYVDIVQPTINFKVADEQFEKRDEKEVEKRIQKVEASHKEVIGTQENKEVYRGVEVVNTENIVNNEGKKGAAQYSNNKILVDRKLLKEKFEEKAWTSMRTLIEDIHGERVESKAENLPENQFATYEEFEQFVIEHEYQHSIYSREDFNAEFPGETVGRYETEINNRALQALNKVPVVEKTQSEEKTKLIALKVEGYKLAMLASEWKIAEIMKAQYEELTGEKLDIEEDPSLYDPAVSEEVNDNSFISDAQIQNILNFASEITDLSLKEQYQLVKYLYNQYATEVFNSNEKIDSEKIKKDFSDKLAVDVNNKKAVVDNLEKQNESGMFNEFITEKQAELRTVSYILNNIDALDKKAKQQLSKFTNITEVENEVDSEDNNETEKNHAKSSLEEIGKKQGSYLLKRFYEGIKDRHKGSGLPIMGVAGVYTYVGFDTIDDVIKSLLTTPTEVDADFDTMMAKLQEHVSVYPWMQDLINKLKSPETPQQIRNTFVKENTRHNLSMMFVLFSKKKDGSGHTLKVYPTNANDIQKVVRTNWKNNLYGKGELSFFDNNLNDYKINIRHVENILKGLAKKTGVKIDKTDYKKTLNLIAARLSKANNASLISFLNEFGISLSTESIQEIRTKGFWAETGVKKGSSMKFPSMFAVEKNTNGIFGHLLWRMGEYLDLGVDNIEVGENNENHPLKDANNILNILSRIEGKYTMHAAVTSFRDADKSIYAKPLGKFSTDAVKKYKSADDAWRKQFLEKAFNSQSIIIKALQENSKFRETFALHHIGITSLKEQGKKVFGDNTITGLPNIDQELVKIGLLQDKETKSVDHTLSTEDYAGLEKDFSDFRIGRLFFPTMADKSQMLSLETMLLNISRVHLNSDLSAPSADINEILYTQTVLPELKRIFDFLKRGGKTDMAKYDAMAAKFVMLPSINDIVLEFEREDLTVMELFEHLKSQVLKDGSTTSIEALESSDSFLEQFKTKSKEKIISYINNEVDNKVKDWKKNFVEKDENGTETIQFLDSSYMAGIPGTVDEKLRVAAYDYVINYFNGQANMHMMFTGDLAAYNNLSDSAIKSKLAEGQSIQQIIKSNLDVNAGKRNALLLGPRAKINESSKETYMQVFLKDYMGVSENIKELSYLLDGDQLSDLQVEYLNAKIKIDNGEEISQDMLQKLGKTKIKADAFENIKKEIKNIEKLFPNSSEYFNLEGSDAQEYTTGLEHLNVLFQEGYLSDELYEEAVTKINKQKAYVLDKGQEYVSENGFPEEMLIDSKDLKLILQPIKPIYSGFYNDKNNGIMRMMYIKTSSFPLIPQITVGFEIEQLRQKLEQFEDISPKKTVTLKNNKTITIPSKGVRASYKSGNKLGASDKGLKVFKADNTFNTDLTIKDLIEGSLELERDNFGIQQDVPVKFNKKDAEGTVSLGTQTLKALFGDGVLELDGFDYESGIYTEQDLIDILGENDIDLSKGKNLHKIFNKTWVDYIESKKQKILEDFGLDKNFSSKDMLKTALKTEKIIQEEATQRGYPLQDIHAAHTVVNTSIFDGDQKVNSGGLTSLPAGLVDRYQKNSLTEQDKVILNQRGLAQKGLTFKINSLDFSVPLWGSPNSNRYESLLNSIVSKRLINIKLPGSSYVVGSEAGFKVDKKYGGIQKSKVIFTSKFDFEKGELKAWTPNSKTQVFLPSRFRDSNGKIINFFNEDGTPNSTYVEKDANGVLKLKEDMIDENLLNITSFRIPTSGHVSMSQLEIVGILPPEAGDLMIVPKNLTVQKGLDFDIDKETTYKLHTYIDFDGKIRVLGDKKFSLIAETVKDMYEETKEAYYKSEQFRNLNQTIEDLEAEIEELATMGIEPFEGATKKVESLKKKAASGKVKIEKEITKEDLQTAYRLFKEYNNKGLQNKKMENEIIKVHNAVLSNPNPKMQKKINRVLSMSFAKSQAEMIQDILYGNQDLSNWSPLSDSHQKDKMELGAVGKLGIGVYSNYVVFHSLLQQTEEKVILSFEEDPVTIRIGGLVSQGELGVQQTITENGYTGKRSVAEVFAERQNTATDNEKEQIMGRLNVNDLTINVDSLLSLLGFDQATLSDGRTVSIPYLLLSQPIIKEYVAKLKETKSKTKRYNPKAAKEVEDELLGELSEEERASLKSYRDQLTPEQLMNMLEKGDDASVKLQEVVLDLFIEVNAYAKKLQEYQKRLNINQNGLGKSIFDTIDKRDFLKNPVSEVLLNSEQLIGGVETIISNKSIEELRDSYPDSIIIYSGVYDEQSGLPKYTKITPTTPIGAMMVKGVDTGYEMWKGYFPFDSVLVKDIIESTLENLTSEDTSFAKKIELRQEIFQELKKYLFSSSILGIVGEDTQEERFRLAIDTQNQDSLATYIKNLMEDKNFDFLKSNPLLTSFLFDGINKHAYSILKFNNSKQEDFDEEYMYQSIITLLEKPVMLKEFNGKPYTTRDLARDLVKYAYLEGGIQKAIQYTKFIPISLLNELNFSKNLRATSQAMLTASRLNINSPLYNFEQQFAQHNPGKLEKVVVEGEDFFGSLEKLTEDFVASNDNLSTPDNLLSFTLKVDTKKQYVSIYNPKAKKGTTKFLVFKKEGNTFHRIPTLGIFGMDEYQYGVEDAQSNIYSTVSATEVQKPIHLVEVKETQKDFFGVKNGDSLQDVITSINNSKLEDFDNITEVFKLLEQSNLIPNDVKIVVEDLGADKNGEYRPSTKTIVIASHLFDKGAAQVAKTLAKELVHRLTYHEMALYLNADGTIKKSWLQENPGKPIPAHILAIERIYREYTNHLLTKGTENLSTKEKEVHIKKVRQEIEDVRKAVFGTSEEKRSLTPREKEAIYPAVNIFEFVENMFTESKLQEDLNEVPFMKSGKTFFEKFQEIIKTFFNRLTKGNLSSESISTIFEIMKEDALNTNPNRDIITEKFNALQNELKNEKIGNPFGNPISEQDLPPIDSYRDDDMFDPAKNKNSVPLFKGEDPFNTPPTEEQQNNCR